MILNMYITMLPVILSGILNMVFTKTKIYKNNNYPIDFNKKMSDGKRIFGENKTWIGMFSMCIICIAVQTIWGKACSYLSISNRNHLYNVYENSVRYNIIIGFLFGFMYMFFELPNSFIKRRLDIIPGKTSKGVKGGIFFIIDQIDSLFGITLVVYWFSSISVLNYLSYILLGGITHILVNFTLYKLKIRKNL